jgi:hypothetical protein
MNVPYSRYIVGGHCMGLPYFVRGHTKAAQLLTLLGILPHQSLTMLRILLFPLLFYRTRHTKPVERGSRGYCE